MPLMPTTTGTASTPVTPGATAGAYSEGSIVPGDDLSGTQRTTQPMAPDGTPSPIDDEGFLTADSDDSLRGNR